MNGCTIRSVTGLRRSYLSMPPLPLYLEHVGYVFPGEAPLSCGPCLCGQGPATQHTHNSLSHGMGWGMQTCLLDSPLYQYVCL